VSIEFNHAITDDSNQFLSLSLCRGGCFPHATVHGGIRETVGILVAFAQDVSNLEVLKFSNQLIGAVVKSLEFGTLDLVFTADLFHQELRIAHDVEYRMPVIDGVLQRR
jgi:hypothetical protein